MNEFSKLYNTLSNSELLEIIDTSHHYQPIAVDAAKAELDNRQLSENQILEAKEILAEKANQENIKNKKTEQLANKIRSVGNSVVEAVAPIESNLDSSKNIINRILIVFTFLLLLRIVSSFNFFSSIFTGQAHQSFGYTSTAFPILLLVTGLIQFSLRKALGWKILIVYCSYSIVDTIISSYFFISMSIRGTFNLIMPQISPISYLVLIILYVGSIYSLSKKRIRYVYKIDQKKMINSIIIGCLLSLFLAFFVMSFN